MLLGVGVGKTNGHRGGSGNVFLSLPPIIEIEPRASHINYSILSLISIFVDTPPTMLLSHFMLRQDPTKLYKLAVSL